MSARLDGYAALYATSFVVVSVSPTLGFVGSLLRLACAGWGMAALVWVLRSDRGGVRLRASEQWAVFLLVGALIAASLSPIGPAYAFSRLLNWLMFWPLAIVFFHRPRFKMLAVAAIVVGLIQTVAVILQVRGVFGGTWGGTIISGNSYNPDTSEWLSRYTGFILNPNDLAILMCLCTLASVAVFLSTKRVSMRLFVTSVALMSMIVLVLTGSRGGLLALAIGLFVFAAAMGARGVAALIGASLVAVWAVIAIRWQPLDAVVGTLSGAARGQDQSLIQRFSVWENYRLTTDQYFLGRGFGGYNTDALQGSGFNVTREAAVAATVDNGWLKALLEGGIVAVTAIAFTFGTAVAALFRATPFADLRIVRAGVAAALACLLWRSFSIDSLDNNPYNAILPLVVGASFAVGRLALEESRAASSAPAAGAQLPSHRPLDPLAS